MAFFLCDSFKNIFPYSQRNLQVCLVYLLLEYVCCLSIKKRLDYQQLPPHQYIPLHVGKVCFSFSCNNYNRSIRALFLKDIVSQPNVITYRNQFVGDVNWKKNLSNHFLIKIKIKDLLNSFTE